MPKAAVVNRRSASISKLNGTTGSRIAKPTPNITKPTSTCPNTVPPEPTPTTAVVATVIETASPRSPDTSSPTRCVSRM